MSFEQNYEYTGYKMMEKPNEYEKYFIMIYKPNENKKEKKDIIKKFKKENKYRLDNEKEYAGDVIKIFGKYFVKQNKNKCEIIYNNKKYKLKEYFDEIDNKYNLKIKEIKIKLIGINNITNMKDMFHGCIHLTSLSLSEKNAIKSFEIFNGDNSDSTLFEDNNKMKMEEENINILKIIEELNEKYLEANDLYYGYSLSSLKISSIESNFSPNYKKSLNLNIKTENLQSESSLFFSKIKNISFMFSGCISLVSLPDLSKWDISKVKDMRKMFEQCASLISLPDISKWNTSNVTYIGFMFQRCTSLISIPDLSNWNISNVTNIRNFFSYCSSLKSLPSISEWDTSNVKDMRAIFEYCNSLISLPDISKWNTSNVNNMKLMFLRCNSLISLPDISKWDTSKASGKEFMLYESFNILNTNPY